MSAFFCNRTTIDAVVTTIMASNADWHLPPDAADGLGRALWDLNARAVAGRYLNLDTAEAAEMTALAAAYTHTPSPEDVTEAMHAKNLACFVYQCSEDATMADPLFLTLLALSDRMKAPHVGSPDYEAAPWGIDLREREGAD